MRGLLEGSAVLVVTRKACEKVRRVRLRAEGRREGRCRVQGEGEGRLSVGEARRRKKGRGERRKGRRGTRHQALVRLEQVEDYLLQGRDAGATCCPG